MHTTPPLRIALIGDYDPQITAHQAIPLALELAARHIERDVQWQWLATDSIAADSDFAHFDGLWCVPGSPYRNTDGALRAIGFARERQRPLHSRHLTAATLDWVLHRQAPAATRAAMRKPKPGAKPQASVAKANSTYSVSSSFLRSNLSAKPAVSRPDAPALKA